MDRISPQADVSQKLHNQSREWLGQEGCHEKVGTSNHERAAVE